MLYRHRSFHSLLSDLVLAVLVLALIVLIALIAIGFTSHRIQDGISSTFSTWSFTNHNLNSILGNTVSESFIFRFLPVLFDVNFTDTMD